MKSWKVERREEGWRLDQFLKEKTPAWISRSMIQKAIKEGKVKVNGQIRKPSYKLKEGDLVEVDLPERPKEPTVQPEEIDLKILYEDRDIIVIDKPGDMIVHPVPSKLSGTLVNALLHHCNDLQGIGGKLRPGIVHRLDKETSGVIVVAKNDFSHQALSKQFKDRRVKKTYILLARGCIKNDEGIIELPLARHPILRIKMTVSENGKEAITIYRVLKRFDDIATLVLAFPKTGRTHQIRVHMKSLGHPIMGDKIYGKYKEDEIFGIKRQMLHALKLGFFHPRTEEWMEFVSPLPEDFKEAIRSISKYVEERRK
ncbi:RluA family pseudouridine synthase [Thermotoga sp. KOL6]|uniref:RluA family pseudouridine synthase n=1 Tax=Thermotoga sp. KOL6 TaxID=126741 RepID=UPI000C7813E8|nr:RluA family pseudouridine synthase [Thermotoga sp. KOL6]PLV59189.1 RNA pseudouridine synthase [Thermotoga sp. KOL6]